MSKVVIKLVTGNDVARYIDELARLRLTIFREYPYLYEGDMEYERQYLNKFAQSQDGIVAIVLDSDRVVGAISGLPLAEEEDDVREPWAKEFSLEGIFYVSEVLLEKPHRGLGLGKELMAIMEEWVANRARYSEISLATVVRPEDDPRRPAEYRDAKRFFHSLGYQIRDGVVCTISWKEIGETEITPKPLQFWSRPVSKCCPT